MSRRICALIGEGEGRQASGAQQVVSHTKLKPAVERIAAKIEAGRTGAMAR
jgi:hypothetical protein